MSNRTNLFHHVAVIMLFGALLGTSQSKAALSLTDCEFGPGSCILDNVSNLEWLQPSLTTSISYDAMTPLLSGTYGGFTRPTLAPVNDFLLQNPGFQGLLNPTRASSGSTFALWSLHPNSSTATCYYSAAASNYPFGDTLPHFGLCLAWNRSTADPILGHALIRNAVVPPVANAGPDQSVRAGDTVSLDGSASFDDNTPSGSLLYSWSFTALPLGSGAALTGADTATPGFATDLFGTYVVALVVTDADGLQSSPVEVVVGTENLAPTAVAGNDKLVIVGTVVNLDGSGSTDPETDPLTYAWSIGTAPSGSVANLGLADTATPFFTPDLEGVYQLVLSVSDFIGPGPPDTVTATATTAAGFAESQIMLTSDVVAGLTASQVTNSGNQNAFLNFLSQAIVAIQNDDLATAVDKLTKATGRTDGCVLRGTPDDNGSSRDWITDCDAQAEVYTRIFNLMYELQTIQRPSASLLIGARAR